MKKRITKRVNETELILVYLLFMSNFSLLGQVDAIIIKENGNIGIGTNNPQGQLHVVTSQANNTNSFMVTNTGNIGVGTANPKNKLSIVGNTDFDGNVGIGTTTPSNKLSVVGNTDFGGNVGIGISNPQANLHIKSGGQTALWIAGDGQVNQKSWGTRILLDRASQKGASGIWITQGDKENSWFSGIPYDTGNDFNGFAIGYGRADSDTLQQNSEYIKKTKFIILENGNVGIGKPDPSTTLDVNGSIIATSINGELPPIKYEVNQTCNTRDWYSLQVDSFIIKAYLGDDDGGTIKIIFTECSTGQVRIITETMYIAPINAKGDIWGWNRQLGGGDTQFILGTDSRYDLIPHPWSWIYMRNYHSKYTPPLTEGAAWKGNDTYKVEFLTRPNIKATIIIYDR
tara:strand:+ start:73792 stop:74991 length:1200 start_codon:yes stop_codon:yes gene_type:complete